MSYASCPKLDVLAKRLIEIHRSTDETDLSSGFTYQTSASYSPIEEIQVAIREHDHRPAGNDSRSRLRLQFASKTWAADLLAKLRN